MNSVKFFNCYSIHINFMVYYFNRNKAKKKANSNSFELRNIFGKFKVKNKGNPFAFTKLKKR